MFHIHSLEVLELIKYLMTCIYSTFVKRIPGNFKPLPIKRTWQSSRDNILKLIEKHSICSAQMFFINNIF